MWVAASSMPFYVIQPTRSRNWQKLSGKLTPRKAGGSKRRWKEWLYSNAPAVVIKRKEDANPRNARSVVKKRPLKKRTDSG
jgi:hypothetical protein